MKTPLHVLFGIPTNRRTALGYRVRFYTLDRFTPADDQGWGLYYHCGSIGAPVLRWKAAIIPGVNFIATDQ